MVLARSGPLQCWSFMDPAMEKINFRASNPQINFEEAFLRIGQFWKLVLSRVGCPHCRFPFALFSRGPQNEKETFSAATPTFKHLAMKKNPRLPLPPPPNVHAPAAENINFGASTPTHRLACAGEWCALEANIAWFINWFIDVLVHILNVRLIYLHFSGQQAPKTLSGAGSCWECNKNPF